MAGRHGGRRVWLGSDGPAIRAIVDDARPYVGSVADFARGLADSHPDIGVAPVGQDDYSRGRSELHWLEYSLAGAATVAGRTMGGGPYDVIRDGVDGLLARNKAQWREQLGRLAASGISVKNWPAGPASASWPSTTSAIERPNGRTRSAGPPSTPAGSARRHRIESHLEMIYGRSLDAEAGWVVEAGGSHGQRGAGRVPPLRRSCARSEAT